MQHYNYNPDMSFDPFTLDQLLNRTLDAAADDDDDVSFEREVARREQSGERRRALFDPPHPPAVQMRTQMNQDDQIIHSLRLAVGNGEASAGASAGAATNAASNVGTEGAGTVCSDLSMEPTPLGPPSCLKIVPSLGYQTSNPNLLSYLRLFASDCAAQTNSLANGKPRSTSAAPQTLSQGVDELATDTAPTMPIPTSVLSTQQDLSMKMAGTTACLSNADHAIRHEQGRWQSSYVASAQACHNEHLGGASASSNGAYDFDNHFSPFYGVEGDDIPQSNRSQASSNAASAANRYIDTGAQMRINDALSSAPSGTRSRLSSAGSELPGWTDEKRFRTSHLEKWQRRYQEMVDFKHEHGHCLVPLEHCENEPLAHWVKRQRCQYKIKMSAAAKGKPDTSTLTDERKRLLDDLSFVWDAHKGSWECRVSQIRAFVQANGHCRIPSRYPTNQSLAIWVKCQRRQYKLFQRGEKCNVDQQRIDELTQLGFIWEPRRRDDASIEGITTNSI